MQVCVIIIHGMYFIFEWNRLLIKKIYVRRLLFDHFSLFVAVIKNMLYYNRKRNLSIAAWFSMSCFLDKNLRDYKKLCIFTNIIIWLIIIIIFIFIRFYCFSYEAWVIYNFMSLCLAWVGGPGAVVISLSGRVLKPSCCLMTCCLPPIPLDGWVSRNKTLWFDSYLCACLWKKSLSLSLSLSLFLEKLIICITWGCFRSTLNPWKDFFF